MKIKLVFEDWKRGGYSVYNTEIGTYLSAGDFHSGTTFKGDIDLDEEQYEELRMAFLKGYTPSFIVIGD